MIRHRDLFPFVAGLTLIAVSLACSGNASPRPAALPTLAVDSTSMAVSTAAPQLADTPTLAVDFTPIAVSTIQPAIPEQRRLTLEFPPQIRAGDSDVISLKLEVDSLGNLTPTAEVAGNVITGATVQIPNLYETHTVTAEARLDLAGVEVRPSEMTSQPLLPGQSVTFYWSVRPTETGVYRGTAWLFLKFVDKVSAAESERALSAQRVEIEAVNFLGLSANLARTAGALGSVVGGVIGFPFFADVARFVLGRRRKKG